MNHQVQKQTSQGGATPGTGHLRHILLILLADADFNSSNADVAQPN